MNQRLLFVSSNPGKVREVRSILGDWVEQYDLDLPEPQALDVEDVARAKVLAAYERLGRPVMVEDTGLYIDALKGLPGALVRWFLLTIGSEGICSMLPADAPRDAQARTAVATCDESGVQVITGDVAGVIVRKPAGQGGFGWDAIFQPDGATKTLAEMDQDEKNRYSMRRVALERFRDQRLS